MQPNIMEMMLQHMARQTECIERYFGQVGNQKNQPAQQSMERKQGTLPSNTVPNPREHCNAIFIHSDTTPATTMLVEPDVVVHYDVDETEQSEDADKPKGNETEPVETIQAVVTRSRKQVPEPAPEPEPGLKSDSPKHTKDTEPEPVFPDPEV